jgi:hypothetical protein
MDDIAIATSGSREDHINAVQDVLVADISNRTPCDKKASCVVVVQMFP